MALWVAGVQSPWGPLRDRVELAELFHPKRKEYGLLILCSWWHQFSPPQAEMPERVLVTGSHPWAEDMSAKGLEQRTPWALAKLEAKLVIRTFVPRKQGRRESHTGKRVA